MDIDFMDSVGAVLLGRAASCPPTPECPPKQFRIVMYGCEELACSL